MLDYNTWKISHLLSIFAHIFVGFVGMVAFVTGPDTFKPLAWGGSVIAVIGVVAISSLFESMRHLQKPCDESNQDRSLNIKLAFAGSMVLHVLLAAFDIWIAVVITPKTQHVGFALAAFGILAAIAGFITLGTVIADIIHLRALHAQRYPTKIFDMPLLETDEDEG